MANKNKNQYFSYIGSEAELSTGERAPQKFIQPAAGELPAPFFAEFAKNIYFSIGN
jgi:hypothetical protein